MASIDRVRADWSGFIGAPGISTFYASDGPSFVPHLRAFFDAVKAYLPVDVHIQVEGSGDTLESTDGLIVGTWTGSLPADVVGTSSDSYSAVSGALVRWTTGSIMSGRRLRGHTFLVPGGGNLAETDGQIASAAQTAIAAAALGLWTDSAGNMLVYQRPRVSPARVGGYGPVTGSGCSSKFTELRSRRD